MRFATAVFCIAVSAAAIGATTPKKKASAAARKKTGPAAPLIAVQQGPLEWSKIERFPPHYVGNSPIAVFASFIIGPKTEFETSAAYTERRMKTPKGMYAFMLPVVFTYDADALHFTGSVEHTIVNQNTTPHSAITLFQTHFSRGSYVGRNAFGVSAHVTREVFAEYAILLPERYDFGDAKIVYQAPPARAIALKPRMRVAMIVSLDDRSVPEPADSAATFGDARATGWDYHSATIDDPEDRTSLYYSLSGDIHGYWLYDYETGEVLARYTKDGTLEETEPTSAPATSTK